MYLNQPVKNSFFKPSLESTFFFVLFSFLLSIFSVNIFLTFFALIALLVCIQLVWRINEPPIIAYIVFYHWFQISIKIFHADLLGVSIQDIALSKSTDLAIFLSLIGLLSLSLGSHLMLRKLKPVDVTRLYFFANRYSLQKLFRLYLLFFVINMFLKGVMFVVPGLTQIIVGFLNLKIVIIFCLFICALLQKRYKILIWIVVIETLFGLTGFFSSFKLPYILLFLAYFTIHQKVPFRSLSSVLPIVIFVILMALTWTAIKPDYRFALNQGEKTQEITIGIGEQFQILNDQVSSVSFDTLGMAVEDLASRLSYVDFFGQVIDYVPIQTDYEYGKLWLGAALNIFQPRILFPDKAILDDSLRTMQYTGGIVAALDEGTSVGLGYFTEAYIDFGAYFMHLLLFFVGLFYGSIYKYFIQHVNNPILAYSMVLSMLLSAALFETRNDKLIGGIISGFIIMLIMNRFFIKRFFAYAIDKKK